MSDERMSDEVMSDGVMSDEVMSDERMSDEMTSDEMTSDEMTSDETMSDETASEETASEESIGVLFVRRDLRLANNPILHHLSVDIPGVIKYTPTHLLVVYVLPPDQVETSGLLKAGEASPYPPALSENSHAWRTGLHRVRFLAESVWDMKESLEELGMGLIIRVGSFPEVLESINSHYSRLKYGPQVSEVYIAKGYSVDELREERELFATCTYLGIRYVSFDDRKPLVNL
jgi:deoxyribodipyrimidine photo-lyase